MDNHERLSVADWLFFVAIAVLIVATAIPIILPLVPMINGTANADLAALAGQTVWHL